MKQTPYKCHILVCTNDREGEKRSCADMKSRETHKILKKNVKAEDWTKEEIRVSKTHCLGQCNSGPIVMIYPQNILYSGVKSEDIPVIMKKINEIMD